MGCFRPWVEPRSKANTRPWKAGQKTFLGALAALKAPVVKTGGFSIALTGDLEQILNGWMVAIRKA